MRASHLFSDELILVCSVRFHAEQLEDIRSKARSIPALKKQTNKRVTLRTYIEVMHREPSVNLVMRLQNHIDNPIARELQMLLHRLSKDYVPE